MRRIVLLTLCLALAGARAGRAEERLVPTVNSASAFHIAGAKNVILVKATVDLPDTCWSNPHIKAPHGAGKVDDQGHLRLSVVADYKGGAGVACGMVFRSHIAVPDFKWKLKTLIGANYLDVSGSKNTIEASIK